VLYREALAIGNRNW